MNETIVEHINNNDQISLKEFALKVKAWWNYFLLKWYILLIVGIICGSVGVLYAYLQKPKYTATLTFAPEGGGGGSLGAYAGIASQFGFDLGMGGDAFEGDNLVEIMRSRRIIERTLFTKVNLNGHGTLIINDYIENNKLNTNWSKKAELQNIKFDEKNDRGPRVKDSILNKIIKDLRKQVKVYKIDKKINIYAVELTDEQPDPVT